MTVTALMRGHVVKWDEDAEVWRYDDGELAPSNGGEERPCPRCGLTAEGGDYGPDPCVGWLPGVTSFCCGHGVEPYVCPDPACGLTDVCPPGWKHTSPADLILSQLMDRDRREREEKQ